MDLTTLPDHLLIVGGGYIGVDFSQMYRRFGSEVTLIVRGGQLLPREDPDVAEELTKILTEEGFRFISTPMSKMLAQQQLKEWESRLKLRKPSSGGQPYWLPLAQPPIPNPLIISLPILIKMISSPTVISSVLLTDYQTIRDWSVRLCASLETDDYVVQPTADVSPPKWHLGHTTWFWETFVLVPNAPGYQVFHDDFSFVFNSYYETVGRRVLRTQRGNMTRPTVAEVYRYRDYVDQHMSRFLEENEPDAGLRELITLGLNHEQQHQELLITDIKYILGHNPLFPAIAMPIREHAPVKSGPSVIVPEGVHMIGFQGAGSGRFHFDNELGVHKVYLNQTTISGQLVTNAEYLDFIQAGGYRQFGHWLADGWAWVNANAVQAPLYWHQIDKQWYNYTFDGLVPVDPDAPVCHVNHFEADAYARWRSQTEPGVRLPTEFEWETAAVADQSFAWGQRWEWTASAYLPYPGFTTAAGAVGEYNGKFMSSQIVLRGASVATPAGHERPTYRNFFQPDKQWQFSGIRLVRP